MPAKKRLTETAPKMCHLECKVNYDGFVKIQKTKRYTSYKQRVAELGTSFSRHFSRTTNMMTSSIHVVISSEKAQWFAGMARSYRR
jgi:phenylpyruvate tautomerase PptA (4-oxalocrotonate tautomerase family)